MDNDIMKLLCDRKIVLSFLGLCVLPLSSVATEFFDKFFQGSATPVLVPDNHIDFTGRSSLSTKISFDRKGRYKATLSFHKITKGLSKSTDKVKNLYLAGRYKFSEMDETLIQEGSFHADFKSNNIGISKLFEFDIDKFAVKKELLFQLDIEKNASVLEFFSGAGFYLRSHPRRRILD